MVDVSFFILFTFLSHRDHKPYGGCSLL